MHWLWLPTLLLAAFTLATTLEPALRTWSGRTAPSEGVIAALMGDSRRLFANHMFVQSDVYLHAGYYPSIFDQHDDSPRKGGSSQALRSNELDHNDDHDHDAHCQHDFLGKPRNWIDAFGRNFFPSKHIHLGDGPGRMTEAREILPWIRFSAELDPRRPDTYTVGAYWLRQMNRQDEALLFLRQGLRANPDSYEILYELGVSYEDRKDPTLARNLWELALRHWQRQQASVQEPDRLILAQILTHLARLEMHQNRRDKAVAYLEQLKAVSAFPQEVQKRIDEVKAGLPFEADSRK
jgi:tetratricopeptide (TPR) repeat protein